MTVRSASSTRRWLHCGLSVRLPQEPDTPGPAAVMGTRFHALVEAALNAGEWVEPDPMDGHFVPALRATLNWFNTKLPGDAIVHTEQAFELKPLGGYESVPGQREPHWRDKMFCQVLPKAGHREYPNVHGAIYGTADVVVLQKGSAHVIDWKTGQKSQDHEAQLLTLALMVAEVHKLDHVVASAVYVDLKTARITELTKVYDFYDLHVHASALVDSSMELTKKELPDPKPGKYCFFCPALGCPEKLRPR